MGMDMVLIQMWVQVWVQMWLPRPFLTFSWFWQVKRAVVQVISAMAHHGYLEQPGGEGMVDYIVQQCALPAEEPEKPDGEELAADSVRAVSIRTLYLVSTTVDRMNSVSVRVFDLRRAA